MRGGLILIAAVAAALGGGQKKPEPPLASEGQPQAVQTADGKTLPAPAPPAGKFDAMSNTAISITGDLTAVDDTLKFDQGQVYRIAGASLAKGGDRFASSGATWSKMMNIPEQAEVRVFRIIVEDRGIARNGGFCGPQSATFLAIHQGVDGSGSPALFINAFKGEQPPSPASDETDLCGTFMYAPKGS